MYDKWALNSSACKTDLGRVLFVKNSVIEASHAGFDWHDLLAGDVASRLSVACC